MLNFSQDFVKAPQLTGSFSPYRFDLTLTDTTREGVHIPNSGSRKLSLNVYAPSAHPMELQDYDPEVLSFWLKDAFENEEQLKQYIKMFKGYTAQDLDRPTKTREKHPLVIFSHGFMCLGTFYSFLIEELVSHGFIVIAINHTHASGYSKIDGEMIYGTMTQQTLFQDSFADKEQQIWIEDMIYVLDQVLEGSIHLPHMTIDSDNIFVMGHSFGGSTAIHVTQQSKHVKGCVNLEGPLFGKQTVEVLAKPCLILQGEDSLKFYTQRDVIQNLQSLMQISETSADEIQKAYLNRLETLTECSRHTEKIVLKGIDHMGFSDFNFLSQSQLFKGTPVGTHFPSDIIRSIRKPVLDFLKSNVEGNEFQNHEN